MDPNNQQPPNMHEIESDNTENDIVGESSFDDWSHCSPLPSRAQSTACGTETPNTNQSGSDVADNVNEKVAETEGQMQPEEKAVNVATDIANNVRDESKDAKIQAFIVSCKKAEDTLRMWEINRKIKDAQERGKYAEWFMLMLDRMKTNKKRCKELLKYFKSIGNLYTRFAKGLQEVNTSEKFQSLIPPNGTLADGMNGIVNFNAGLSDKYTDLSRYIIQMLAGQISNLLADYVERSDSIISSAKKLDRELDGAREFVDKQFSLHTEIFDGAFNLEKNNQASSGSSNNKDPWISEQQYRRGIIQLNQQYASYKKSMSVLFEQFSSLEEQFAAEIKSILNGYLARQKALLVQTNEQAIVTSTVVDAIDPVKDRLQFVQQTFYAKTRQNQEGNTSSSQSSVNSNQNTGSIAGGGLPSEHLQTDSNLSRSMESDIPPVSTYPLKTGYLYRQSSVVKSWKKNFFVVSRHGFLYCFESQKDTEPARSVSLTHSSVKMVDELLEKHAFEIIENPPGFFKSMFKVSNRYILRAETEEEMVDWIVVLRQCGTPQAIPN